MCEQNISWNGMPQLYESAAIRRIGATNHKLERVALVLLNVFGLLQEDCCNVLIF